MADAAPKAPRPNLFVIDSAVDELAAAFDQLEDGEVDEATKALVFAWFGNALDQRDAKLESYAGLIRAKEFAAAVRGAEAAGYLAEGKRLKALADADLNVVKRLKVLLKAWLVAKKLERVETRLNKFWIQSDGGVAPVEIHEKADPAEAWEDPRSRPYVHVSYEWDKEAIRADLEAGTEIPFAKLGDRGTHLRVK